MESAENSKKRKSESPTSDLAKEENVVKEKRSTMTSASAQTDQQQASSPADSNEGFEYNFSVIFLYVINSRSNL